MPLPLLPIDKANHFVYGSVIALVSLCFVSPVTALWLVSAVAVAKEVHDMFGNGTPDFMDAIVTIIGGSVPVLASVLTA